MNKKIFFILINLSIYGLSFAETASRIRPLVRELKAGKRRRMRRRRKRKQSNEAATTTSQSKNTTSIPTISFVQNAIDDVIQNKTTGDNPDAEISTNIFIHDDNNIFLRGNSDSELSNDSRAIIETLKSEDKIESESDTTNTRSSSITIDEREKVSNAPSSSSKQNRLKPKRSKKGKVSRGRRSRNKTIEGPNIRDSTSEIGGSKVGHSKNKKDKSSKVGISKDKGDRSKDGRSKHGGSKLGKGETAQSISPIPSTSSAPSWSSTQPSISRPTRGAQVGGELRTDFPSSKPSLSPSLSPSEEPSESPSIIPSATPSACIKYARPIVADSFCTAGFQGHNGSIDDMIRILSQGNGHANFSILKEGLILDETNLAVRPNLNNCTSSSDGNAFDGVFHGECVAGYASITLLFYPETSQQGETCGACIPESHTEYCAYAVEIPCEPVSFDCLPSSAPSTSPSNEPSRII